MEALQRVFLSEDWITFTFLFGFVLLFLMKMVKPQRLLGYSIAFFTQGFIEKRVEQNKSFFSPFHMLIFLFSLITISLSAYLIISFQGSESSFLNFLLILGCVFVYFIIQSTVNYSLSKILNINSKTRYFFFAKSGYLYAVCLWIFPILIIYQYGFNNINFLVISVALLFIFRVFLILQNNKKLIFNQLFYFILYFCTLELAPLLILYKVTTI